MVKSSVLAVALALGSATGAASQPQVSGSVGSQASQGTDQTSQGTPQSSRACAVLDVSVFTDRVHVRCESEHGGGNPSDTEPADYFAVSTGSPFAPIFATVATAAQQARKPLTIVFWSDPARNPLGCQMSDCRAVVAARFIP